MTLEEMVGDRQNQLAEEARKIFEQEKARRESFLNDKLPAFQERLRCSFSQELLEALALDFKLVELEFNSIVQPREVAGDFVYDGHKIRLAYAPSDGIPYEERLVMWLIGSEKKKSGQHWFSTEDGVKDNEMLENLPLIVIPF